MYWIKRIQTWLVGNLHFTCTNRRPPDCLFSFAIQSLHSSNHGNHSNQRQCPHNHNGFSCVYDVNWSIIEHSKVKFWRYRNGYIRHITRLWLSLAWSKTDRLKHPAAVVITCLTQKKDQTSLKIQSDFWGMLIIKLNVSTVTVTH